MEFGNKSHGWLLKYESKMKKAKKGGKKIPVWNIRYSQEEGVVVAKGSDHSSRKEEDKNLQLDHKLRNCLHCHWELKVVEVEDTH